MKFTATLLPALLAVTLSYTSCQEETDPLPAWNDGPVKEQLLSFLNDSVDAIPVADRIAVFDMDGTLVCEKPWGIETMVSIYRLLEQGEKDRSLQNTMEYQYAKKLSVHPRDTSVLHHLYDNGQNYPYNLIMKPFDGADCEEYVAFARHCLNTQRHTELNKVFSDLFYQPMLEFIEALKQKQFQIYVVSASMQGIVWSICPQELGLERDHLIGIRHPKRVSFPAGGPVRYTVEPGMLSPTNNYEGKALNFYDRIGKNPVVAVGNAYSDFGMFHMAECSAYPHLSLLLHHDDAEREYAYEPTHSVNWQDTMRHYNWLQADFSKAFKKVWKE